MNLRRTITLRMLGTLVATAMTLSALPSPAAVTVFLDYTNFTTRLNQLTSGAGVSPFTTTEQDSIKSGILSNLQTAFDGFDISFSETSPGGAFPRLWFGDSGGGFGVADHIDYRNKQTRRSRSSLHRRVRFVHRTE